MNPFLLIALAFGVYKLVTQETPNNVIDTGVSYEPAPPVEYEIEKLTEQVQRPDDTPALNIVDLVQQGAGYLEAGTKALAVAKGLIAVGASSAAPLGAGAAAAVPAAGSAAGGAAGGGAAAAGGGGGGLGAVVGAALPGAALIGGFLLAKSLIDKEDDERRAKQQEFVNSILKGGVMSKENETAKPETILKFAGE